MLRFIGQKLLHVIPVLLIVSLATMLLIDLTPGDPAFAILGDTATPEQIEVVHEQLGLNDPFLVRWGNWIGDTLTGDLGTSLRTRQSVAEAIKDRLPVTLELSALALGMALIIAIPLGVYTAYRADRRLDRWASVVTSLFVSSPAFLTGLVLSYFFAVRNNIFPVTGWVPISDSVGENLRHAFLPAVTLALAEIAVLSRLLRADMIATLQDNFILAARAKGLPDRYILFRHAFRPSSFSLLTLSGLALGRLIGGAVIVESLFSLPGLGQLLVQSIIAKDLIMVQGVVLFIALTYVVINTVIDISYAYIDPRVRVRF